MSDKTAEELQNELTEMTSTAGEWREKCEKLQGHLVGKDIEIEALNTAYSVVYGKLAEKDRRVKTLEVMYEDVLHSLAAVDESGKRQLAALPQQEKEE